MSTATTTTPTCNDCKMYLPVDVFKGACKVGQGKVGPDVESCDRFTRRDKCKFCAHFTPSPDVANLGLCGAGGVSTYPDLNGTYCSDFTSIG